MSPTIRAIVAALIASPLLVHAQVPRVSRFAQPPVVHVPLAPPALDRPDPPGAAGEGRKCVVADAIVGATVLGDRTIELLLGNGERLHMSFSKDCPFVGFYQGFYYPRTTTGHLCARRDSIIDRSGTACAIEDIRRHKGKRP